MATVYNNENLVGSTTGTVDLSAATVAVRVLFSAAPAALNNATSTATFVNTANTAGTGLSSGTGSIKFDTVYAGETAYIILADRTSFSLTLQAGARTLTPNGFEAWGPTERRLRHLEYI
jgi:hypothetical protein